MAAQGPAPRHRVRKAPLPAVPASPTQSPSAVAAAHPAVLLSPLSSPSADAARTRSGTRGRARRLPHAPRRLSPLPNRLQCEIVSIPPSARQGSRVGSRGRVLEPRGGSQHQLCGAIRSSACPHAAKLTCAPAKNFRPGIAGEAMLRGTTSATRRAARGWHRQQLGQPPRRGASAGTGAFERPTAPGDSDPAMRRDAQRLCRRGSRPQLTPHLAMSPTAAFPARPRALAG